MRVEREDPAVGGDYFPISDLTGKVVNLTEWQEQTIRSGSKYRVRIISPTPPGYRGKAPGAYDDTCLFNGKNSWKYRPRNSTAEQDNGSTKLTRVMEDYYGDMIGFEINGISRKAARTVPSGTDEPFDVDQLIPSGHYQLGGEDVVEGEPCVIIERPGLDRVWLALGKSYVVVKREWCWTIGGPLKRRILNQKFKQAADGVWLPFEGRMEVFGHPTTRPGQRVAILKATVREAQADVADAAFEPDFPRGTLVVDVANGKTFRFGWTEEETAAARAKANMDSGTDQAMRSMLAYKPEPWWRRRWLLVSVATVLLAISALVLLRARNKA